MISDILQQTEYFFFQYHHLTFMCRKWKLKLENTRYAYQQNKKQIKTKQKTKLRCKNYLLSLLYKGFDVEPSIKLLIHLFRCIPVLYCLSACEFTLGDRHVAWLVNVLFDTPTHVELKVLRWPALCRFLPDKWLIAFKSNWVSCFICLWCKIIYKNCIQI